MKEKDIYQGSKERGFQSEDNVIQALGSHPLVESILRHDTLSEARLKGIDLTIYLVRAEALHSLKRVFIKVKASDEGIQQDITRLAQNYSKSIKQEQLFLRRRGLMLLNGDKSEAEILADFDEKLAQHIEQQRQYRSRRRIKAKAKSSILPT